MVGAGEGVNWNNVFIGAGTNLTVSVNSQALAVAYNSPSDEREEVGVDAVDIGGTGGVDVWYANWGESRRNVTSSRTYIYGGYTNGDERNNLL